MFVCLFVLFFRASQNDGVLLINLTFDQRLKHLKDVSSDETKVDVEVV